MNLREQTLAEISKILANYYKTIEDRSEIRFGLDPIRVAEPLFDYQEVLAVVDALLEGWLAANSRAFQLESDLTKFIGATGVHLTSSGSSANLLAMSAASKLYNLSPGDEIITPALTFPTTVNAILHNSLKPVFLDSIPGNYTINVNDLESSLSTKVKGLFIVHTIGNPADMKSITEFADQHNLFIVEDACDALGATFNNNKIGGIGDIGTFSFYPAHHITTGEGGAVSFHTTEFGELIKSLRDWGRIGFESRNQIVQPGDWQSRFEKNSDPFLDQYDKKFVYENIGYNFKITEFQSAMGLAQLKRLNSFLETRNKNYNNLYNFFSSFNDFFLLPTSFPTAVPSWLFFPLTVKPNTPFTKNEIVFWLESNMIETRPLLAGNILRQPGYREIPHRVIGNLFCTDEIMKNTFCIGLHPKIGEEQIHFIEEVVSNFIKQYI